MYMAYFSLHMAVTSRDIPLCTGHLQSLVFHTCTHLLERPSSSVIPPSAWPGSVGRGPMAAAGRWQQGGEWNRRQTPESPDSEHGVAHVAPTQRWSVASGVSRLPRRMTGEALSGRVGPSFGRICSLYLGRHGEMEREDRQVESAAPL